MFFCLIVYCKYENTAFLEIQSQPSVLPPGESSEVNRECKHYHEVIPFEINGLSVMSDDVLGQGTEIKVRFYVISDKKCQCCRKDAVTFNVTCPTFPLERKTYLSLIQHEVKCQKIIIDLPSTYSHALPP